MIEERKLVKLPVIISIVMLFLAIAKGLPYGYYVLLRIVVCATAIYLALFAYKQKKQVWVWIMGGVAFLFNPLIRVTLHKTDWGFFDLVCGLVFIVYIFYFKPIKDN
jgi:hypothetical protein